MAVYSDKVLKGEELYYYTTKIRMKLKEIEDATAESFSELNDKIDENKRLTDEAIADLASQNEKALMELEDTINRLKLELNVVGGVEYSEYYYGGAIYQTLEEAKAAARAAGDTNPDITHSDEVVGLLDKNGEEVEPSHNYLYLVPSGSGDPATSTELPNSYNEYIWTEESGYELVGSTDVDLAELSLNDIDEIWNEVF